MLSGDWIGVRLPERIKQEYEGAEVVSLGGATEGSIWSIMYRIEMKEEEEREEGGAYRMGRR